MTSTSRATSITKVMQGWQFTNASAGLDKGLYLSNSVPTPTPGRGQVLVQVTAAAVNPIDYKLAETPIVSRLVFGSPGIPALDFAGRVVQSNEHEFQPGQKVFGRVEPGKSGALGQFVVVGKEIAKLPDGVDDESAAAMVTTGLTAYQYYSNANVPAGSKVFINGGSGGVGPWAIQIAKVRGYEVTTSCSTRNVELCKSLGADVVIDYSKEDLIATLKAKGQYFDLVVDNVGQPEPLYIAADTFSKPTSKYIQVGAVLSFFAVYSQLKRLFWPSFLGNGSRQFVFLLAATRQQDLNQLAQWLAEKKIKAIIDSKVDFGKAPEAYAKLKTGHAQGKIVVNGYPESTGEQ